MAHQEIRSQIKSVQSTRKITRAMEMVAASKMRKAQDAMFASRPYAHLIRRVMAHVVQGNLEHRPVYLEKRPEIRRIGLIIISSDRGLCGGLNNSLFRQCLQQMKAWQEHDVHCELALIGRKAHAFFGRLDVPVVASHLAHGDKPRMSDLIGTMNVLLENFRQGQIDAIHIASNQFVNTMVQKPAIIPVVPVPIETMEEEVSQGSWDYLYEPEAAFLLETLVQRYIESTLFQAVLENGACEQAARMVAMKSASENALDLIERLKTTYNKARQASITQEISEICAGAAAV